MVCRLFALIVLLAVELPPVCYGRLTRSSESPGGERRDPSDDPEYDPFLLKLDLSNGETIPLIGIGVDNIEHDHVEARIARALKESNSILIDAPSKQKEREVANAIAKAIKNRTGDSTHGSSHKIVNVVTKVWYTHLGYERTRLSVKESLEELSLPSSEVEVRVHMLLEWPRCTDNTKGVDCKKEEKELPDHVKRAGPPPHLDIDNAWKESWRALEDMYNDATIPLASIGVSNFDLEELEELVATCRIKPHLLQGNVYEFVRDRFLMHFARYHGIVFQTQSMTNSVIPQRQKLPNVDSRLKFIGKTVRNKSGKKRELFSPAQVVLAWLTQNKICVVSTAPPLELRHEYSPEIISRISKMNGADQGIVGQATMAILSGNDMDNHGVLAAFVNAYNEGPIELYWRSGNGEEVLTESNLEPGTSIMQETFNGHVFVAYAESRSIKMDYKITADYGANLLIRIDMSRPKANFVNSNTSNSTVHLHWADDDGVEVPVSENLQPGEENEEVTSRGQTFVVYDESKSTRREIQISGNYGEQQRSHVEL